MRQSAPTDAMPARNWIDGAWVGGDTVLVSIDPATGETIGHFAAAAAAEAELAIAAARRAFDQTPWSRDIALRSRALLELADRLQERFEPMAAMLSREGGKLIQQAAFEIGGSVAWLRYAAATALLQNAGRAMDTAEGARFRSVVEPIGVVGVITPWNSPIILTVRAIGPALAAGCSVVVKLPAQTGLTNALFSDAVAATTALPPGIVNVFSEGGTAAATRLVESPDIDAISFTGSTHIGRKIAAAGAKTLKRMNLELGGKTPLIVFDDADLAVAVPTIIAALLAMNGQFCCTGSRVLVHRGIAEAVRSALIQAYEGVRVGPGDDPESQLGPLVDKASVARVDAIVEAAAAYGTVLVRGGPTAEGPLASGAFYRPSLVEVQMLDAPIVQNEVFGPVQTFEIFDDEADAITRANGTEFGLAASVITRDAERAARVGRAIRAGTIWTNCWGVLSEHFEQAGYKQSGVGLLCGPRAIEEFQLVKVHVAVAGPSV